MPDAKAKKKSEAPPIGNLREYELLEKLGEGGMGAVYKARHSKLDKVVAIKVLPADKLQDEQAVARFEREMRAVGKLEHPNIVRAMDAGEVNGMHFLVMEYVRGVDLSQLVKKLGPLPIADSCEMIRQAAVGLDEADDHDMVHRDIKPSNLILAHPRRKRKPMVKILDMGLALLSEAHSPDAKELTHSGQMMGTLDYMAPEQGGDTHNVDIRADIYSLGAALYRLLTGQVIYHGEQYSTPVQKIVALATKPAPPVQERRAEVPAELAAVLHRMLAKLPEERHQTPEEVAEALAPFCNGSDLATLIKRADGDLPAAAEEESASAAPAVVSPADVDSEMTTDHISDAGDAVTDATGELEATIDTTKPLVPEIAQVKPLIDTKGGTGGSPTSAAARTQSKPSIFSAMPKWLLIGGGLAALLLIGFFGAAATVFFLPTADGTLRVEVNDPDIKVQLKGTNITFTQKKQEPIEIKPGEKTLVVTRDGFTFETNQFILKKGETTVVKVDLLPGKVRVVSDGHVIGLQGFGSNSEETPQQRAQFALTFDGKRNWIDIPTLKFDGSHPITLEAHVTLDADSGDRNIIGDHWGKGIALKVSEGPIWRLASGGRLTTDLANSEAAAVGRRVHVAGTWDEDRLRLFVDGKEVATTIREHRGYVPSASAFAIGRYPEGRGEFSGTMDEIRVSKVVRYTKDFIPQEEFKSDEHTLALYHFDEGSGDVLHDSSGNNHHGKIVGAKWVKVDEATSPKETQPSNTGYALQFGGGMEGPQKPWTHIGAELPMMELPADGDFTFEFWMKGSGRNGQIPFNALPYRLEISSTKSQLWYRDVENNINIGIEGGDKIDKWVHVASVVEGDEMRHYVSGQLVGSKKIPQRVARKRPVVTFGGSFYGEIDEVRLSNVARYDKAFTPQTRFAPDRTTVGLYHLDEGSGLVLKDSSGNDRHGKISPRNEGDPAGIWVRPTGPTGVPLALRVDRRDEHVDAADENLNWQPNDEQQAFLDEVAGLSENDRVPIIIRKLNELGGDEDFTKSADFKPEVGNRDGQVVGFKINAWKVQEIWPLVAFTSLDFVDLRGTSVTDFRPLARLPLKVVHVNLSLFNTHGEQVLKNIETIELINAKTAANFFAERAAARAEIEKFAAEANAHKMPVKIRLVRVTQELQKLNPQRTDEIKLTCEDGELKIPDGRGIHDLSPLRVLPFHSFTMANRELPGGPHLYDLSPLAGLPLTEITITGCPLRDLSPLQGMPLKRLSVSKTTVEDLRPLAALPLEHLDVSSTRVTDFSPVASLPLKSINERPAGEFWQELKSEKPQIGVAIRKFAEWVLAKGGTLKINVTGATEPQEIKPGGNLPKGEFKIVHLVLNKANINDDDLARFDTVPPIPGVDIFYCPITDAAAKHLHRHGTQSLYLPGSKITSKFITDMVAAGWSPRQAGFSMTAVDDDAISSLLQTDLDRWSFLRIHDSKISQEGAWTLAKRMTKAKISADFDPPPADWKVPSKWSAPGIANRRAAEVLLSLGGQATVELAGEPRPRVLRTPADLPDEAFRLVGVNLSNGREFTKEQFAIFADCHFIRTVIVAEAKHPGEGAVHFANSPVLTELNFYASGGIGDDVLAAFEGHTKLKILNLSFTKVTDKGIAALKDCNDLEYLEIPYTSIGDAGLSHFGDCSNLKSIRLARLPVTDAGLAHFKSCKKLETLVLRETRFTDEGLKHLTGLTELTSLDLTSTACTAGGLAHFNGSTKLKALAVGFTQIDDAAIDTIKGFANLERLYIDGTKITSEGVAALKVALPKCEIYHE